MEHHNQQLPKISVRVPPEDIEWLKVHYGNVTDGIHAGIQLLRGTQSLIAKLQHRFAYGGTITLGALLIHVRIPYPDLWQILTRAKEAKALKFSMRKVGGDDDMVNMDITRGPKFDEWCIEMAGRF